MTLTAVVNLGESPSHPNSGYDDVATLGAAACSNTHRICFYADCPDDDSATGHTFLQLVPAFGGQACRRDLAFGFYTAGLNKFTGDGIIYVCPVEMAVRIRTGERDHEALTHEH